jgi:hypothetical protein
MTGPWLGIGLLCALAAAAPSQAQEKDPIAFVADKTMHRADGSWSNPNAEAFLRLHNALDGIPVRLADGGPGVETACAKEGMSWLCRVGRESAMSDGLYRFILKRVAPDQAGPAQKDEAHATAGLKPDAAGIFPGYRGMSLPVPGHQLVFLKKGDRADVMVTFDAVMEGKRKEKVTATILQNVVVVDVVKAAKSDLPGVVQILLNPNEAQYAALSDAQGDIHIVRRAPGDTEMHPMEMASFRKLFR